MNRTEQIKSWWSKSVEKEKDDTMTDSERFMGKFIILVGVIAALYFIAHQMMSTGFFTANLGILEMVMLYGYLIAMMISGILYGFLGRKHLSRYFDVFGGMLFAAVAVTWLFVVFPFDFAFFADVLPDFLRFFVQWISNDIARVVMILIIIVHVVGQVWMGALHVFVRKARSEEKRGL